ncbi:MAG: ATPase domain-containing protein [Gemmatimonadota bacterium]
MLKSRLAKKPAKSRLVKKTTTRPRKLPVISQLKTGVPGLDEVLGGGLPELSFNLIAGGPGSGKTTMAMQILFANSTAERPGLFITLLGEPALKLLRYQQPFEFFEMGKIGSAVHFLNLSEDVLNNDLDRVLARIVAEVDRLRPGFVVIDSFRSLVRPAAEQPTGNELEYFVQRLALHLTTWEITSFLIGEYVDQELRNPVFTVADGIIWLSQDIDRNSVVRKLQIVKSRGLAMMPGLHTFRLSSAGLQIFPRMLTRPEVERPDHATRLSTGIKDLDEMMGGGIPAGDSVVIAGPTGTGKTTFATQFVGEGLRHGEGAVIAVFEEHPADFLDRARSSGVDFDAAIAENKLRVIYIRPLDLSVDEALEEIRLSVKNIGATRVVIDSISGLEMALAPTFREDFRESLYRLVSALKGFGVTIVLTVEVLDASAGMRFTNYGVSFLTDDIIVQRYVEIEGQLRKVMTVVKMRGSQHSREFRTYEITAAGVEMGDSLREYDGIITGVPTLQARIRHPVHPGLTEKEMLVLETLARNPEQEALPLAKSAGITLKEVEAILTRLVDLDYASLTKSNGGTHYRGLARPTGA